MLGVIDKPEVLPPSIDFIENKMKVIKTADVSDVLKVNNKPEALPPSIDLFENEMRAIIAIEFDTKPDELNINPCLGKRNRVRNKAVDYRFLFVS